MDVIGARVVAVSTGKPEMLRNHGSTSLLAA